MHLSAVAHQRCIKTTCCWRTRGQPCGFYISQPTAEPQELLGPASNNIINRESAAAVQRRLPIFLRQSGATAGTERAKPQFVAVFISTEATWRIKGGGRGPSGYLVGYPMAATTCDASSNARRFSCPDEWPTLRFLRWCHSQSCLQSASRGCPARPGRSEHSGRTVLPLPWLSKCRPFPRSCRRKQIRCRRQALALS